MEKNKKEPTHHHTLETRLKVVELHNAGWSKEDIFQATNVAKRTQRKYIKNYKDGKDLNDKPRKTEMWNQRNSKVTEEYLEKLKTKLEDQNDLSASELSRQLLSETGIEITERRVQQIEKELNLKHKAKTKKKVQK
jgi:transposase